MSKTAAGLDPRALSWSIDAMDSAWSRIHGAKDEQEAYVALGEAVWWATVVDKTLERTDAYQRVTDDGPVIRKILRGLRSVRNRIGQGLAITDFVYFDYALEPDGSFRPWVTTWKPVVPPAGNVAHALGNHQAYVEVLEGEPVLAAFSVAARCLRDIADATQAAPL